MTKKDMDKDFECGTCHKDCSDEWISIIRLCPKCYKELCERIPKKKVMKLVRSVFDDDCTIRFCCHCDIWLKDDELHNIYHTIESFYYIKKAKADNLKKEVG